MLEIIGMKKKRLSVGLVLVFSKQKNLVWYRPVKKFFF